MRALTFLVAFGVLLITVGCGTGTRPQVDSLPPQSLSQLPPPDTGEESVPEPEVPASSEESPASAEQSPASAEEPSVSAEEPSVSAVQPEPSGEEERSEVDGEEVEVRRGLIVLEDGGSEESQEDMISRIRDASLLETERRKSAPPPAVVITDKNLAEMAEGGKVTIVRGAPTPEDEALSASLQEQREEEVYWRTRARDIRQRWRDAYDRTAALEGEAAGLRERFYLEDDPFVRDGQIKPEWDRVLDELDEAREETEEAQAELEILLDEGRRSGALPGWLREGIELEPPPPEEPESLPEQDVREPTFVREPPR